MIDKSNFNKLFEPIQIGRMTIKNRIAMAPMGTAFATLDGLFTEQAMAYYEVRAKGGAGLIIIENVGIDFHRHIHASNRPAIDNDLPLSSLANGHFAHTTEYEDDGMPEGVSAYTLYPPLFALAEKLGSPGSRVLEAFASGYEVQSRLGIDCNNTRKRGYLNLSMAGVPGIAAGAAKLSDLDVQRTAWALSLAASQGCGLTGQTGTDAHFIKMGIAGRDGLTAAFWAAEGLTGSPQSSKAPRGSWT